MSTPHNNAKKEDIAKTVLMPGDPLRAKYIAEKFLDNARLVNEVRGMYAFTGEYNGKTVTVMASGMGMPSMGIYSYELFSFYDVENIIRIGTAGAISENVKLRDVVLGIASCTNSSYADSFGLSCRPVAAASYKLLRLADDCAKALGIDVHVGTLLCTDTACRLEEDGRFRRGNGKRRTLLQCRKNGKKCPLYLHDIRLSADG